MNNFKIKSAIGIGDIIIVCSYFKKIQENYDKLIFYPNTQLLPLRGNEYKIFISDFFNWINNNTKFELSYDPIELKMFQLNNCIENPEIYITPINIKNLIPDDNKISEPYICINTKIRQDVQIHGFDVDKFMLTLQELSNKFKIVLLGEQGIPINWENQILIKYNKLYTIYSQLKELNNIIDLTIKPENIINPNLNYLLKDLSLYKNSKFNINIGNGGNVFLSGISGNCINLTGYPKFFSSLLTESFNTQEFVQFNDKIKQITAT